MVTVGMNYVVRSGKEETFENAFRKVIHAMQGIAGHSVTRMFRDIDNNRSYLIMSDWSDRAAFDGFIRSDTFRAVANWGSEQILEGRPSHTYHEH